MADGWERCLAPGCNGAALGPERYCLRDLGSVPLDAELERIRAEGTVDARGVTLTPELLTRVLEVMPRKDGRTVLGDAQFEGATFEAGCTFDGVDFTGHAGFIDATFRDEAKFGRPLPRPRPLHPGHVRERQLRRRPLRQGGQVPGHHLHGHQRVRRGEIR